MALRLLETKAASVEIARRFASAILGHIDGHSVRSNCWPSARRRRTGAADEYLKKRTLVAGRGRRVSGELVVNILGLFHGGQN